jgi:hypothetical protein
MAVLIATAMPESTMARFRDVFPKKSGVLISGI